MMVPVAAVGAPCVSTAVEGGGPIRAGCSAADTMSGMTARRPAVEAAAGAQCRGAVATHAGREQRGRDCARGPCRRWRALVASGGVLSRVGSGCGVKSCAAVSWAPGLCRMVALWRVRLFAQCRRVGQGLELGWLEQAGRVGVVRANRDVRTARHHGDARQPGATARTSRSASASADPRAASAPAPDGGRRRRRRTGTAPRRAAPRRAAPALPRVALRLKVSIPPTGGTPTSPAGSSRP
jgi:hypothetical protein